MAMICTQFNVINFQNDIGHCKWLRILQRILCKYFLWRKSFVLNGINKPTITGIFMDYITDRFSLIQRSSVC